MAAPPQAPPPGRVPHLPVAAPVAAHAPLLRPVPGAFGHLLKGRAKGANTPLPPPAAPKAKAERSSKLSRCVFMALVVADLVA